MVPQPGWGFRKAFSFTPVIKTPFDLLKHLAIWQLQKFNKKSKGGPNGGGAKLSLINKMNINIACAHTRKTTNNIFFAGGNKTHMDQENDAFKSSVNCRGLLNGLK